MERRVLLAISLSFLVLFVYQTYFAPPPPAPRGAQAPASQHARRGRIGRRCRAAPGNPDTGSRGRHRFGRWRGESTERDITVETHTVRAVFTNRGARLKHWLLKRLPATTAGNRSTSFPNAEHVNNALMPFSLRLDDAGLTSTGERRSLPQPRRPTPSTPPLARDDHLHRMARRRRRCASRKVFTLRA